MGTRKRIALIFSYNENWIGGTYYIQNLINALNVLPDEKKPEITVCTFNKNDFDYLAKATGYPYLVLFKMLSNTTLPIYQRVVNKITAKYLKKKFFNSLRKSTLISNDFELVFPISTNPPSSFEHHLQLVDPNKRGYWIPDFQEDHLPDFFSLDEIANRKKGQIEAAVLFKKVVFSSNDAQQDFMRLYPFARCEQYVIPFAVTLPKYEDIEIHKLKEKFGISGNYFYAPNQFWIHKNHEVIIKAISLLKKEGINVTVALSGKENDYRISGHTEKLKNLVKANNLGENILFLGFIDRGEQLCLMKNADAIIQPSLFEGWSTVVEDAKAMNQFIIASNLNVHKEQLKQNSLFFDPYDASSLVSAIKTVLGTKITIEENLYDRDLLEFANNFLKLIE
jgi:glycosyltransferase involved in cell wall biosynthesis